MATEGSGAAAPRTPTERILREARALVVKGWARGVFAADKRGKLADLWGVARPPRRFCVTGAIYRAAADEPDVHAFIAMQRATRAGNLIRWNDSAWRTKRQVLAAFDRAIAIVSDEPRAAPPEAEVTEK